MSIETWQWSRGGNIHAPPRKWASCASSCSSPNGGVTLPDLCAPYYWYPTMYPYHEPSGASVVMAGYLTSPSGTGCPSSSGNSSGKSGSSAGASSGRSSAELGVSSSLKQRLDDLEFLELLQALHEDYLACHRPPRNDFQYNPSTLKDDFDAAKTELGRLERQSRYLLNDFGFHDVTRQELLAQAYRDAQEMSGTMKATEVPPESTYRVLGFRGLIHHCEPNDNTLRELAQAHRRMADFLHHSQSEYEDAMMQYQDALDWLDQSSDECSAETIAACLFGIATVLLKMHGSKTPTSATDNLQQQQRSIQRALGLLEEAMEIRQNLAESEANYRGIAEILIALGDAHNLQAHPNESLGCYEAALAAIESAKLGEEHPLRVDALMALGDCISGNQAAAKPKVGSKHPTDRALNCYYAVVAVAKPASEHHEQAMLKAAVVHFDRGEIGSALENLAAFLQLRLEKGDQEDLAYFMGLLSISACHFVNFNSFLAKSIYEEARGLIAFKENKLLVENPMLETYLWNIMVDGVLPFRE